MQSRMSIAWTLHWHAWSMPAQGCSCWAPLAPPSQSNLLANGSPCAEFGSRGESATPALLLSWEQIPTTHIDPGHCSPEAPRCTLLKLVRMFSVGHGLSLHSQVASSTEGERVACRLPARSFHAQHLKALHCAPVN